MLKLQQDVFRGLWVIENRIDSVIVYDKFDRFKCFEIYVENANIHKILGV